MVSFDENQRADGVTCLRATVESEMDGASAIKCCYAVFEC